VSRGYQRVALPVLRLELAPTHVESTAHRTAEDPYSMSTRRCWLLAAVLLLAALGGAEAKKGAGSTDCTVTSTWPDGTEITR